MRESEKMRRRDGLKGFCPGASRMKEEVGGPQSTSRRGSPVVEYPSDREACVL